MAVGPGLTYHAFLRGRQPNPRLAREYSDLVKSRTPRPTMPPSGRTPGDMSPPRASGAPSTGAPTRRFGSGSGSSTAGRGSGVPWDGGGDNRGLATGTTDPVPPSGGGSRGGGGGRTGVSPSGRGGSFGSGSGSSGYTGVDPRTNPMPRGGSFTSGKGASAASKGASGWSKAGKFVGKAGRVVGKAINSPMGKMAKFVGGKAILPLALAKAAGDTFGAFEPGIDMLRYGHKAPYKDGVGGRDNRVNDMLGNISPLEMIKDGMTQEVLSNATGGASAKFLKAVFPYRERPKPAPAAAAATPRTPSAPARPSAPAPQQPGSIPDMGRQGRAQSKALRDPESYLGSAFDATLRKGIDTGRNYLRSQMNKDGLDAEDQSKIMARFDSKIAGDKELSKDANKGGIINTIAAKDAGRGQRTLEAYRGQRGEYRGNTSYKAMQEKYVK